MYETLTVGEDGVGVALSKRQFVASWTGVGLLPTPLPILRECVFDHAGATLDAGVMLYWDSTLSPQEANAVFSEFFSESGDRVDPRSFTRLLVTSDADGYDIESLDQSFAN